MKPMTGQAPSRYIGTPIARFAATATRISHLKPSGDRLRWGLSEVAKCTAGAPDWVIGSWDMLGSYMAMMKRDVIPEFFARLKQAMPEPETELEYDNVYQLLVAVELSAQATDVGVNRATGPLFKFVKTPQQMVELGETRLIDHIKTIGLFRTKAKNVIALSHLLLERHGGEVPNDHEALQALPGVGRKTANVVMNVAFGEATIAVDTHIFRVGNRTGLAPGKNPMQVELKLMKRVPEEYRMHAHHWLILHGRYTCKARKPECPGCVVNDLCTFRGKTTLAEA